MPINESPPPGSRSPEHLTLTPEDAVFLEGSGKRMYRDMLVLGLAGVAVCWLWHGWRWAGGFAAGAALSALNFHWMHSAVATITDSFFTRSEEASSGGSSAPGAFGSAFRIMLRYALIAAVGYVIFKSAFVSLSAFFIGLFLFLGAVLVEAAYELYCGLRSA